MYQQNKAPALARRINLITDNHLENKIFKMYMLETAINVITGEERCIYRVIYLPKPPPGQTTVSFLIFYAQKMKVTYPREAAEFSLIARRELPVDRG